MTYRFISICALIFFLAHSINAQTPITVKEHMMYTNVIVSHKGASHTVQGLIDTGSSVCLIDSTFAVDSCNIKVVENNATIGNTSGKRINSFRIDIDSVSLGGVMYSKICCYLVDLLGKFQHNAPKFVLGGDILKRGLWGFDLKQNIMTLHTTPLNEIKYTFNWKNHDDYSDAFLNAIILKGKVAGKKTRILFDTGSKRNELPQNFGIPPTKTIEIERADIAQKLRLQKEKLCENVNIEIADKKNSLDFILCSDRYPRINATFLWGETFVLDYGKKRLYVLD